MRILRSLAVSEYAALCRACGEPIVTTGGIGWRRVRPCFYRPAFPLQAVDPGSVAVPRLSFVGGVQHLVPAGCAANSSMSFLVFDQANRYALEDLTKRRRYDVRRAARNFEIRRLESVDHFVEKAHAAYCSFFQRTGYSFRSDRVNIVRFRAWAETLFDSPGVGIWGAYRGQTIHGASVGVRVNNWLVYSTFFASTESLKLGVSDLMLHSLRQDASREPGLDSILAATPGKDRGLDRFYLRRGATQVSLPARLQINPLAALLLRATAPGLYHRAIGVGRARHSYAQ